MAPSARLLAGLLLLISMPTSTAPLKRVDSEPVTSTTLLGLAGELLLLLLLGHVSPPGYIIPYQPWIYT